MKEIKSFRDIVNENNPQLIDLLKDFSEEDIAYITGIVLDMLEENDWEDEEWEDEDNFEDIWAKEDLLELISDLDSEDLEYIKDIIGDISGEDDGFDWDEMDEKYNIVEKMSNQAKIKMRKKRKKPAHKKAMRLKKKCQKKHKVKIKKSKNAGVPYVCGTDGKIKKGMKRGQRRKLKKTRKRNRNKVIK